MSTNEEIRVILFDVAPEFYTVDSTAIARVDRFIDRAKEELSESFFGSMYDEALAYLTAYKLKMVDLAGVAGSSTVGNGLRVASGIVLSEKLGDQQVSFADAGKGSKAGEYSQNIYGIQFEAIKNKCFASPFALGGT
jgi:hypothetical protein